MAGVPRGPGTRPGHHQEQALTGESLLPPCWWLYGGPERSKGQHGHRRLHEAQGQGAQSKTGGTTQNLQESPRYTPRHADGADDTHRVVNNVLRSLPTIGGHAPISKGIRPDAPPDKGRSQAERPTHDKSQMGKELTTLQSVTYSYPSPGRRAGPLPSSSGCSSNGSHAYAPPVGPAVGGARIGTSTYCGVRPGSMEFKTQSTGYPKGDHGPPWYQKDGGNYSIPRGLYRAGGPATRWMELRGL